MDKLTERDTEYLGLRDTGAIEMEHIHYPFSLCSSATLTLSPVLSTIYVRPDSLCVPYIRMPNGAPLVQGTQLLTTHYMRSLLLPLTVDIDAPVPPMSTIETALFHNRATYYTALLNWHRIIQFYLMRDVFHASPISVHSAHDPDVSAQVLTYLAFIGASFHSMFPKSPHFLFNETGLVQMLIDNDYIVTPPYRSDTPLMYYTLRDRPIFVSPAFFDAAYTKQLLADYYLVTAKRWNAHTTWSNQQMTSCALAHPANTHVVALSCNA